MTTTGGIAKQMTAKIWVPRSLQVKAVFLAHSNSGHCGSFKTLAFLRKQYVFPKMYALTYKLVLSCEVCNVAKRSGNALQMPRQLYSVSHRLFDHCNADFVGPFVTDVRGMRYCLVIICRLTHYTALIRLNNITADNMIKAINEQFVKYLGLFRILTVDNGPPFTSEKFKSYCTKLGSYYDLLPLLTVNLMVWLKHTTDF